MGFWGWSCHSYIYYLLGMCTAKNSFQTIAGEDCKVSSRGIFMIPTNSNSPYASGRITEIDTAANEPLPPISTHYLRSSDPFQQAIDIWGKLEGNFNNLANYKDSQHINIFEDDWNIFREHSNKITRDFILKLRHQHEDDLNNLRKVSDRHKVFKVPSSKRKLTSQQNQKDKYI